MSPFLKRFLESLAAEIAAQGIWSTLGAVGATAVLTALDLFAGRSPLELGLLAVFFFVIFELGLIIRARRLKSVQRDIPSDDQLPSRTKHSRILVGTICVAVAIVSFAFGRYSKKLPDSPATIVQAIDPQIISALPVVEEGRITSINIRIKNQGPELAQNVRFATRIKTITIPNSNAEEKTFLDEVASGLKTDLSLPSTGHDIAPGTVVYETFNHKPGPTIVADLKSGRTRLYIITLVSWDDRHGSHLYERCVYLRPPATDPVWRLCKYHNALSDPMARKTLWPHDRN